VAVMFETMPASSSPPGQTTESFDTSFDHAVQALAPGWMLQPEIALPVGRGKLYKWALKPSDDKLSIWVIQYSDATEADARLRGIRLSVGEHWVTGIGDAAFAGFVSERGPASLYLRVGRTYAQIFVPSSAVSSASTAVDLALSLGQRVARIVSER
jgi:hypothetical protein